MSEIDAACFDLDSTLCVSNQSDSDIHEAVFDRAGIDPLVTPEEVRAVDSADLESASFDADFYASLYRAAVANRSTTSDIGPSLFDELGEITADVVDQTDVSFRPGADDMLAYARERYDVGLITNGVERAQRAKLETLGITDAFDVAVYCDPAAGIDQKPSTEPFRRALSGLSASATNTLYVGNDYGTDVVGAHAAGLQSAWLPLDRPTETTPSAPEPAPTYRLESPADLTTIL